MNMDDLEDLPLECDSISLNNLIYFEHNRFGSAMPRYIYKPDYYNPDGKFPWISWEETKSEC
jgi:hypothetical protein